jgi:hypothetical protein
MAGGAVITSPVVTGGKGMPGGHRNAVPGPSGCVALRALAIEMGSGALSRMAAGAVCCARGSMIEYSAAPGNPGLGVAGGAVSGEVVGRAAALMAGGALRHS